MTRMERWEMEIGAAEQMGLTPNGIEILLTDFRGALAMLREGERIISTQAATGDDDELDAVRWLAKLREEV